ncbi:MAG: hypothetical protein ATN31_07150 [Candidatus Epulonipiscioides saccharophilum]|nr:MAG: hypothetical protein ATN31_07150 [Epulopiscium sp. AS2M-Bin001]
MEQSGRKTGYFGKWHLGLDWDASDTSIDFDICRQEGNRLKHLSSEAKAFVTERGQLIKGLGNRLEPEKNGNQLPFYGKIESKTKRYEHKVTQKALNFLEENKENPWSLIVSFVGPHFPSVLPEPYFSMYPYNEMVLPENITDTFFNKPWFHSRNWWPSVATDDFTKENWQKTISAYYGCITMMDDFIGEILEKASLCSGDRPTKVIFTSDHGEMLGAHARFDKDAYFYEEVLRTPLLYCSDLNSNQAGFVRSDYVGTLDIAQTLFDLAGSKSENGISLSPLLLIDYSNEEEKVIYGQYYKYNGHSFEIRFIRTPKFKYSFIPQDIDELYDIENDSLELVNLSDNDQYDEIKSQLKALVIQHMKDTDDYLLDLLDEKLPEAGTLNSIPYPPLKKW